MTNPPWGSLPSITPELQDLLERSRNYVMSPEERREQRISFVYANLSSRSTLTKDDVRRIMEEQGL